MIRRTKGTGSIHRNRKRKWVAYAPRKTANDDPYYLGEFDFYHQAETALANYRASRGEGSDDERREEGSEKK